MGVVAVAERNSGLITQPGVVSAFQVPQMVVGVDQIHAASLAFCVWSNAVVGCVDSMLNIEDMAQVVTSCFYIDHSVIRPYFINVKGRRKKIMNRNHETPDDKRPEQRPVCAQCPFDAQQQADRTGQD